MTNPNDNAFSQNPEYGLTKREYFALKIYCTLILKDNDYLNFAMVREESKTILDLALLTADEFIKGLNKDE